MTTPAPVIRPRILAAKYVSKNWRVRKRLPRVTRLATLLGYVPREEV